MKQKKFADVYLETGNGALAVRESYAPTTNQTQRAIASENLTKPNVIEYLQGKASRASERMVELSDQNENLTTAYNATKDILDRTGHQVIDKSLSIIGTVEELRDLIKADLERLRKASN